MRIGIDATALTSTQPTGVEVVTRELVAAVLGQDTEDQFILYTPAPLDERWKKFPNLINRVLPPARFWLYSRLSPAVVRDNLDVFWAPSNMLPFKLPPKSLATVHDLAFIRFPAAYSISSRFRSWLTVWRAARVATKIIAVSQATKADLVARFNLPDNKIEVVDNALPSLSATPDPVPMVSGDYVLVIGRVEARKNPTTAIKALALIAQQYPKLQLIFAGGRGYQAEAAEALVAQIGLASRIHFLGFVTDAQIANLYLHAKLLLFPSLYEGFGLPILEAFHFGTPVICSNTPALTEVAGDAALVVESTDSMMMSQAISRILSEPDLRGQLIEKGTQCLQQYSWERSAAKLISIIKTL